MHRARWRLNNQNVRFGSDSTETKPSAGTAMSVMPLKATDLFSRRERSKRAKSIRCATQTTCNDEAPVYLRGLCIMGYGYFLRGSSSGLM
jgi:hypothetical protein